LIGVAALMTAANISLPRTDATVDTSAATSAEEAIEAMHSDSG